MYKALHNKRLFSDKSKNSLTSFVEKKLINEKVGSFIKVITTKGMSMTKNYFDKSND